MFLRKLGLSAIAALAGLTTAFASDDYATDLKGAMPFSWSGFYVGASVGPGTAEDYDPAFPVAPLTTIALRSTGAANTYGGHLGYSHQFGNFVVGAEYEFSQLDIQFVGEGIGPLPIFIRDSQAVKLRGGYAFDKALVYITAGKTLFRTNIDLQDWIPTLGMGMDIAITDHVIAGLVYEHSWYDEFDGANFEGTMDRISARLSIKF